MLYLSQILNSKIQDSSDKIIGRLEDIIIKPKVGSYSVLDSLLIKGKDNKKFSISYEYVENLSKEEISLKCLFSSINQIEPKGDESIYLKRDVLDQQIVDLDGARVIRVNDLKLGLFEDKMSVLGIDISTKGLFRRLGIGNLDFFDLFEVHLIDWRRAQLIKGSLHLDTISKNLTKLHPADLANIIEDLNLKHSSRLVRSLDAETAAQVFEEIEPTVQKILVSYLGPEKASKIIDKMSVDEITDLMQLLPKHEAEKFLSHLENDKLKKIEKLINYKDDTAGGLMTTDYMNGQPEWTVKYTIEQIKKQSPSMRSMLYIYVTDKKGIFKGAISLRRLLISDDKNTLNNLVKNFPLGLTLHIKYDLSKIIKIMTKYNLYTAAVLDEHRHLIGMVTIDDVMRRLAPRA